MKKLVRPPNQYHYLLFLILLLGSVPFQISAETPYAHVGIGVTSCVSEAPTGSISSSSTSKTPLNSDIEVSKESTNETSIHIPNAKPLANSRKTRKKACGGHPMVVQSAVVVWEPSSDSTEPPNNPPNEPEISESLSMVFSPDFFILEISITGNGSGIVTTPEGNSYSSAECSSDFCEEWYPITWLESDVKKSSRSDATRDSVENDSSVEITVKAESDPTSKLKDSICEEPQQEQKVIEGQTKNTIVVHCTATFELKPLEISVPLTSSALGKNGNFSDTATTFLGSVANLTGLDKDDANKVLLHSATDVKITGTIAAEPLHIGQLVDMLAVVGFTSAGTDGNQPSLYYMLEGNKVKSWDGNLVTLLAFQENVSAEPEQTLEIYQGSLLDGQYEIYFGYRLEEGTIIFNSEPLRIQLRSANP